MAGSNTFEGKETGAVLGAVTLCHGFNGTDVLLRLTVSNLPPSDPKCKTVKEVI